MIRVTITTGRLTQDPEVRYGQSGKAVAGFAIAESEKSRDPNGNPVEVTTFLDCTAFGKTAENIGNFFGKGSAIILHGKLTTDKWVDKQTGQERSKIKMLVDTFEFPIGNPRNENNQAPQTSQPPQGNRQGFQQQGAGFQQNQMPGNPPQFQQGGNPPPQQQQFGGGGFQGGGFQQQGGGFPGNNQPPPQANYGGGNRPPAQGAGWQQDDQDDVPF